MFYGLWRYSHIKLLHFKLIALATYLDEEVNVWSELAVCRDVPLKCNTGSYTVIFVFCKCECDYIVDNAKTG